MQIFIPVTLIKKFDMQTQSTRYSSIHPQTLSTYKQISFQNNQQFQNNFTIQQNNHQDKDLNQQDNIQLFNPIFTKNSKANVRNNATNQTKQKYNNQYDRQSTKQLQRKSTRSQDDHLSVFDQQQHKNPQKQYYLQNQIIYQKQPHEDEQSGSNLMICNIENDNKRQSNTQFIEARLQTDSDIISAQQQKTCKICLQTNMDNNYDQINNSIIRTCLCKDFIHIKCLQEWITRRDIINDENDLQKCQVCLQKYEVEIGLQSFLNCEILSKNLKIQKAKVLFQLIPSVILLVLTILSFYTLIELIIQQQNQYGYIKSILGMPFGTCLAICIFTILVLILILYLTFYSWLSEFLTDYKYKVQIDKREKISEKRTFRLVK